MWQAGRVGQRQQGIGPAPVLFGQIAVEMCNAEQILSARITPPRRCRHIWHCFLACAPLEQKQPIIIGSSHVSLLRRLCVECLCLHDILIHTASQPIGLGHVELCVGITLFGRSGPLAYGIGEIAIGPGIDARFDIGVCCYGKSECSGCHAGEPYRLCHMHYEASR